MNLKIVVNQTAFQHVSVAAIINTIINNREISLYKLSTAL